MTNLAPKCIKYTFITPTGAAIMDRPFLFVNSAAMDGRLRKRIRRHVMTGRNAGKTFHRRSRLDLSQDVGRQVFEKQTSGVSEEGERYTYSKEAFPITNDRNFRNPFRSFRFSWETTAGALDIFDEYFSHVVDRFHPCRVGISADDAKSWWFNIVLTDEAAYHCTLAIADSCNHLLRGGGVSSPEALFHRSRTLSLIRKRLEGNAALSDSTLGIIIMLMVQEQIRAGAMETFIHFDGLRKAIDLRGGLSQLEKCPALLLKVCKMDILYAFQYGKPIYFFRDRMSEARTRLASKGFLYDQIFAESSTRHIHVSPCLHEILIDAISVANLLNAATGNREIDLYTFSDLLFSMCYRLITHHPPDSGIWLGGAEDVYHIGLTLFVMTLFMQYDHKRILRCDLVSTRCQNVLDRELGELDDDILLWLALIGGMWIDKGPEKTRNNWKIRRLASNMGISAWSEARAAISPFPWVKAIHEIPGLNVWDSAF